MAQVGIWTIRIGRFGYFAKGVVYATVGMLSLLYVLGMGGSPTGSQGAIRVLQEQAYGSAILILVVAGLASYSLWRLMQAIQDVENKGSDFTGLVKRVGFAVSALIYLGLSWSAFQQFLGRSTSGNSPRRWTADVLALPLGSWLIILAGVIGIGVGAYHVYRGYRGKFSRQFNLNQMTGSQRKWVLKISRFGIMLRGLLFMLMGNYAIIAGVKMDAGRVQGLEEIMQTLSRQNYGPWLLGFAAAGLMAYGAYSMTRARYRRF